MSHAPVATLRPQLFQLLPPTLDRESLSLAHSAAAAALANASADFETPLLRTTLRRGLWDAMRLSSGAFARAEILQAFGPSIWGCIGARVPVIYTPQLTPTPSELAALKLVARSAPLIAVASSPWSAARLRRSRIPFNAIHIIPPTGNLPAPRTERDLTLREQLGFAPSDLVVLATGDSTRAAGHDLALWAVAILAMTDRRWKLLLAGNGHALPRLRRFAAAVGDGTRGTPILTVASDLLPPPTTPPQNPTDPNPSPPTFTSLLPACDFAVYPASAPTAHLLLLESLAAQVPTLATRTPITSALLPDALILDDPRPRALARRLHELSDPTSSALQANLEIVAGMSARLNHQDPTPLWSNVFDSLTR